MKVLCLALLAVLYLTGEWTANGQSAVQKELEKYHAKVKELYNLLAAECPSYLKSTRSIVGADHPAHLEVQKMLYNRISAVYEECKKANGKYSTSTTPATTTTPTTTTPTTTPTTTTPTATTTTTTPTTTTPTTTPTTTTPTTTTTMTTPTTTPTTTTPTTTTPTTTTTMTTPTTTTPTTTVMINVTTPSECLGDVDNKTDWWRKDYNGLNRKPGGSNSKDGYACDQHKAYTPWFRFTGRAGNRIYDKCPKKFSCGTAYPFWTDEPMPTEIGVPIKINVYGVIARCKSLKRQVIVMRCSSKQYDYIYQQTTRYTTSCQSAFCSMS